MFDTLGPPYCVLYTKTSLTLSKGDQQLLTCETFLCFLCASPSDHRGQHWASENAAQYKSLHCSPLQPTDHFICFVLLFYFPSSSSSKGTNTSRNPERLVETSRSLQEFVEFICNNAEKCVKLKVFCFRKLTPLYCLILQHYFRSQMFKKYVITLFSAVCCLCYHPLTAWINIWFDIFLFV